VATKFGVKREKKLGARREKGLLNAEQVQDPKLVNGRERSYAAIILGLIREERDFLLEENRLRAGLIKKSNGWREKRRRKETLVGGGGKNPDPPP